MHLMNDIFHDELDHCILIYVDDILIFSPLIEQHLCNICTILKKLQQHWLYAKLSKCKFLKKEVLFLGHHISAEGLKMGPDKIKAILEWPDLTSKTNVLSFLDLVNFYHKHLEHLPEVATPLSDLQRQKSLCLGSWSTPCLPAIKESHNWWPNPVPFCSHWSCWNPLWCQQQSCSCDHDPEWSPCCIWIPKIICHWIELSNPWQRTPCSHPHAYEMVYVPAWFSSSDQNPDWPWILKVSLDPADPKS